MPPPYVAVQNVKPAETTPTLSPSQLNARLREVIAPQQAPSKPRQGDVPARPARMPMYAVLAMQQKRAVMGYAQSGVVPKAEFDIAVSSPYGKSLAWDERINIERQQAEAYGSRFTITPQQGTDEARIRLLMGV
jgi:hypothetical protein